ncbi:pentatricopeptide repeat-containing protein [Tanacetum coccineum]
MNNEHTSVKQFKYGPLVSYKWIGRHFGTKIRLNPDIKLYEIADLVLKKYKCIVSPNQCRNAKRWALNEGETTIEDHYACIRSYAKAVVNVENKDNWIWFLDLLCDDLEMPNGNGLTLMSDQHKGLIEGEEVMPHAEHRQCARHRGFRKQFSGVEFRQLFWAASKATYLGMFNKIMEKIKRADPKAYDYLLKKEPKTWSMAYFHIGTNCEVVENRFTNVLTF